MTFSKEWDKCFIENTHMSVWPWSDVVGLVNRHCKSLILKPNGVNILELGCGAGANIDFFKKIGFNYYSVEGSPTIVNQLHKRFPDLTKQIICGDFTEKIPFDMKFDLILDRSAITHNNLKSIKQTLKMVKNHLKTNSFFIGIDWFSTNHSEAKNGSQTDDEFTRSNFFNGPFVGVGKVHFSDLSHICDLLSDFKINYLEEKIINKFKTFDLEYKQDKNQNFASWNFIAR
tara:strand:+ start:983 stop:1672 length:690 start_codon:yes stop_codon:yes gene_type:complete